MTEGGAALALLVLCAPLLLLLAAFVWLADGRPVLYRGERLGRGKRRFVMIKLRTLRREAERCTADRLVDSRDGLEIPGGRLLRDSRLDELPQLWNIVRGDMHFIGPRPERPRVYQLVCRQIPGYARRFQVDPGMIGPSQLFTPHATDKRIRTWLDNAWAGQQRSTAELVGLTAYTALVVAAKSAARAFEALKDGVRSHVLRRYPLRRRLRRVQPVGAAALLVPEERPGMPLHARVLDLNEDALRIRARTGLRLGAAVDLRLEIELGSGRDRAETRSARCTAVVTRRRRVGDGFELVLKYSPSSPRSHYVIHQYFLGSSLARPRGRAAARRHRLSLARRAEIRTWLAVWPDELEPGATAAMDVARRSTRSVDACAEWSERDGRSARTAERVCSAAESQGRG